LTPHFVLGGIRRTRRDSLVQRYVIACLCGLCLLAGSAARGQQQAPSIGYMHPSGGRAGTTVDVGLGGYVWTPDMELFVYEPGIQLELAGTPGPVIVPEPPYWFEKKARRAPFMMPSETPAKLTIPANVKPGVYRWQVANANGAAATGRFVVSDRRELLEPPERTEPLELESLPVVVSGQILKIEEVDRYRLVSPHDGPITVSLTAAAIGSPLTAGVEVRDADGSLVAEASDTAGTDLRLTFAAKANQDYVVQVYDVDFRGNRSFVYRLDVAAAPRVVAAIPAAGRRGETRDVQFLGYGLATGAAQLETVTRSISFPSESAGTFQPQIETPFGIAEPFPLLLSDLSETVEPASNQQPASDQQPASAQQPATPLAVRTAITGVLDKRYGTDRYVVDGKKGDVWNIELQSQAIGSSLDVALSVLDDDGKTLKRIDDLPGTTDAGLEFVVPADGNYALVVSDSSGTSGTPYATYRLIVQPAKPGFTLSGPELVNLPLGGKVQLTINATRVGGFDNPITLQVARLPAGVTAPDELIIPEKKNVLKVELSGAADAGTAASLLRVTGTARVGESDVTQLLDPILLAVTMKVPYSIDAEGKNDVTKWPRGTTFPAPVLVEREEGFTSDIVLQMAAKQGRHRQGIRGPELTISPDVDRILYPVFLPEWLETTRTSRMVVNGVAQIPDPKGKVRYVSSKLKTRIGFLPTGALLKIDCTVPDVEVSAGQPLTIPLTINRAKELTETVTIELVQDRASEGLLLAEPLTVADGSTNVRLTVNSLVAGEFSGEREITIRATVLQRGQLPVISETNVLVVW